VPMNVMLTSAGRRNYLVQYFRKALKGCGKVVAVDANENAPAMSEADLSIIVPTYDVAYYVEILLSLCEDNDIGLLLPLNDLELPILAKERSRFQKIGTFPVVSSPDVIDICFDKWKTTNFLREHGIPCPLTYTSLDVALMALDKQELIFPLVVKPRWGSGSIGVQIVRDREELRLSYSLLRRRLSQTILGTASEADPNHNVLIQECLLGEEYGLDVVNDFEGNYVTTFVKQKLGMRAGETDRAKTVDSTILRGLGERIGRILGHIGNLDCDVFVGPDTFGVLEMNPRFGGGYPFSHAAGANLPAAFLSWADGRKPNQKWLSVDSNIISSKCDRLLVLNRRNGVARRKKVVEKEQSSPIYLPLVRKGSKESSEAIDVAQPNLRGVGQKKDGSVNELATREIDKKGRK
jgi:carbamoyl-phosphate synthase large subunit